MGTVVLLRDHKGLWKVLKLILISWEWTGDGVRLPIDLRLPRGSECLFSSYIAIY